MQVENDVLIVDRSTLERYATCPRQGRFTDIYKPIPNDEMASGIEAHDVISKCIGYYIESSMSMSPAELKDQILVEARQCRPDLQPDVMQALSRSAWSIAEYIANLPINAIICHDGGKGSKSGQLAMDLAACRITSECDLLHATASKEVVQLIDWKTGHKYWTESDVANAFQFQMLALLIFDNFPDVKCVRVSIWNTRSNTKTYSVEFTRERHFEQIFSRVSTASGLYYAYHEQEIEETPHFRKASACEMCQYAFQCWGIDGAGFCPQVNADNLLFQLHQCQIAAGHIEAKLRAMVAAEGSDVIGDLAGLCYGSGKPKADRRPTMSLYELK